MQPLKIPDLLIESSNVNSTFESSGNLLFAHTVNQHTELYFENKGLVLSNTPIARLKIILRDKGFLSLGDNLMIRIENLREIIHEDFEYYVVLKGCKRIRISAKESEILKRSLRRIAS